MIKRTVMTVCGVLTGGFSAGMFNFSGFGMDPFQVLAHGIWGHVPFSYGPVYTGINLVLLVLMFITDRKKIGLGTLINLFLLGYVVEFSSDLWMRLFPEPSLQLRVIFLAAAIVIMCLGSSLYFTADLGVSTYDAIALTLSQKQGWPFRFVRITTDAICTLTGYLLGAAVGIGTLITALFMGPLIDLFNRTVAEPLLYGKRKTA